MDELLTLTAHLTTARLPALEVVLAAPGADASAFGVRLGLAPVIVGKDLDVDLRVDDPKVSRLHCSFTLTETGIVVRDLGSKNGTFVAGVQVVEAMVGPDVLVTVGDTRLHVARRGVEAEAQLHASPRFGDAVGTTIAMRALFAQLARVAASDATVVLLGESGTGKELLAQAIHDESPRAAGPFAIFDAGAVPAQLVESELFGFVRGAFTGATEGRAGILEQADGGTLFLDEIGELPLDLQPKLLRAIETRQFRRLGSNTWKPFDVRIIAATHRDLRAAVTSGAFRSDLYYRLAVVTARVPPLRERKADLEILVDRFLATSDPPRSISDLPPHAMAMLQSHDWPGNVRELRNTLTRMLLFPHLGFDMKATNAPHASSEPAATSSGIPFHLPLRAARAFVVEAFERLYLVRKLEEHGGNVSQAATAIGVSRQMIHRLIERYGIR